MEPEIVEQRQKPPRRRIPNGMYCVVSGKERKVKEYLDKDIIRSGWQEITNRFSFLEKVYKVQNGKK